MTELNEASEASEVSEVYRAAEVTLTEVTEVIEATSKGMGPGVNGELWWTCWCLRRKAARGTT